MTLESAVSSSSDDNDNDNDNENGSHKDYPMSNIDTPHPHDVLNGRGGGTNNHVGNTHWRMLVAANKQLYVSLPKRQKQLLSKSIVNAVRTQNPPGRFLQKDESVNAWFDIGDQRACEKTSQALREGAKEVRQELVQRGELPPEPVPVEGINQPTSQSTRQQRHCMGSGQGTAECAPGEHRISPLAVVQTKNDTIRPDNVTSERLNDFQHVDASLARVSHHRDISPCSHTHNVEDFEVAMVGNGVLEPPGISFGSSMGASFLEMPSGLESQGMSFGSTIGPPTHLDPAALSMGSAMSYSTTHTAKLAVLANPVDFGLEPGVLSTGSFSMTSDDQKEILAYPQEAAEPLGLQRRATSDLINDDDSVDDEDDPSASGAVSRSSTVDYETLEKRLNIKGTVGDHADSLSRATSAAAPLPPNRDVSSTSSLARFMSNTEAFSDEKEMNRQCTQSIDPTDLTLEFSGFSLDNLNGMAHEYAMVPPPRRQSKESALTDEEMLALYVSQQDSAGVASRDPGPEQRDG